MDIMSRNEVYIPDTKACISNATIYDRLVERKKMLSRDLDDVNAALDALNANPEVLKILCLISKICY